MLNFIIDIDEEEFDDSPVYKNEFVKSTEYKLWYDGSGYFQDAFISFFTTYLRSKGINVRYIECYRPGSYEGTYRFCFRNEKDALFFRLKYQTE